MPKVEGGADAGGSRSGGGWRRECEWCRAAPVAVYCRADAAYLCGGCDARVHGANRVASRHERVWVCEACELAPAAVTCRADAAALCAACDAEIHSANPLARRHFRVPILPISAGGGGGGGGGGLAAPFLAAEPAAADEAENNDEDEAASWLPITKNCNQNHHEALYGAEGDEYLDLVGYNTCNEIPNQEQQQRGYGKNEGSEFVVPSHRATARDQKRQQQCYGMDMEYDISTGGLSYTATGSHSVSDSVKWVCFHMILFQYWQVYDLVPLLFSFPAFLSY
ncbi:hypothetical protein BHE74_00059206 [Ensete ventricosum]|nr:hypothetical protein BHE74_00059206 [Ensete ventricosum]